jgi:hypothetical protein
MSYGDGFFDMPAGYSDADLEMAELEELGRRAAKRYRGFSDADRRALEAGATVTAERWFGPADDRRSYLALVRMVDSDEVGPILDYSLDGRQWFDTARAARLAFSSATGATVGDLADSRYHEEVSR